MKKDKKKEDAKEGTAASVKGRMSDFFGMGKPKNQKNPMTLEEIDEAIAQAVCSEMTRISKNQ